MPATVTYISHDGATTTHEGATGESVMKIAVRNGVEGIVAECGGSMSCSTCHVFVAHASVELPGIGAIEEEMLDTTAVERRRDSRLSCQLVLPDGAEVCVHLPSEQM